MKHAYLMLVMMTLAATPAFGREQETRCYQLHMGEWKPAMNLGGDEIYSKPPQAIALTNDLVRVVGEKKEFAITPALGAKPSVHKRSYWYPEDGKLTLVWTSGYSGLRMNLKRTKDGLFGTARTFWDFERQVQESSVPAPEVHCDAKPD